MENRFILDLSTEEDLMNSETLSMFEEDDGYRNWLEFLTKHAGAHTIPCALYVDEGDKDQFQKQVTNIINKYGKICLRTSVVDEAAPKLYRWITEVTRPDNVVTCGVLYYIEPKRISSYESWCQDYIQTVIGNRPPNVIIFPGSSFPRYVTDLEDCDDLEGEFEAREVTLEKDIQERFSNLPIERSDFASIHPIRYQTGGGNWIPRIDIFDGATFRYVRARRDDGGYDSAAQELDRKLVSRLPSSWGKKQIELAMAGTVTGGSPSFWISVRINCWITQRAQ